MRLMIAVGLLVFSSGAAVSLALDARRARASRASGLDLIPALRTAILCGVALLPGYGLVLWATGSLDGGVTTTQVIGNWYVRQELFPITWGSQNLRARAGQKLVLAYDMTVERGELDVRVSPSKPVIGILGPFTSESVWKGSLDRSGVGKIDVPIERDGYYLVTFGQWARFVGRYRLSWRVECRLDCGSPAR